MNNETEQEHYADFISYYRDNMEAGRGYKDFWRLNIEYNNQNAKLDRQSGKRIDELHLRPNDFDEKKTIDVSAQKTSLREEYKGKADELARKHGFKGMSYDDHLAEQNLQKEIEAARTQTTTPQTDKEQRRQAFIMTLKDTGKGLAKGKEPER